MSSTLAATLVRAIIAERSRLGLTQDQMGGRLGWSRGTIAKIEAGERQLAAHELVEICRALEVTLLQLLSSAHDADLKALGLPRLRLRETHWD